jgi:hypothetical protein
MNEHTVYFAGSTLREATKHIFKDDRTAAVGLFRARATDTTSVTPTPERYYYAQLQLSDQSRLSLDNASKRGYSMLGEVGVPLTVRQNDTGQSRTTELVAIIGAKNIINFTGDNIHKPHWWDPMFGK